MRDCSLLFAVFQEFDGFDAEINGGKNECVCECCGHI